MQCVNRNCKMDCYNGMTFGFDGKNPMSPELRHQLKVLLGIDYDEMEARHRALIQELDRVNGALEAEVDAGRKPNTELLEALKDVTKRLRGIAHKFHQCADIVEKFADSVPPE
jgi:hypothetical protein